MSKAIAVPLALLLAVMSVGLIQAPAHATGGSRENPIIVSDVDQVPEGAIEDEVSQYDTVAACDTTRSWVHTVPASAETSHQEFKFGRFVPAVEEESHNEWAVEKRIRSIETVEDFVTEYHFRKFTRTRERTYTEGTEHVDHWWNWSPNNSQGPQNYTPGFPTDSDANGRSRGTWQGPHTNGGPQQGAYGTFQTGGGNSPFFHRVHISDGTEGGWSSWSEYGAWTQWEPASHESWEDNADPIGSPQAHGTGRNANVQWQRQWQALHDGVTREVKTGEHEEFSDWTAWTVFSDNLTVDPTPRVPADTDLVEWRVTGPVKVVDVPAISGYREFYVLGGEPSRNIEDASWVRVEQAPGDSWSQFAEREVKHENGTPEVVTHYAHTDGKECEKPEGFENTDTSSECVDGDLVTTSSTTTGTPIQDAVTGAWEVVVSGKSSQSIEKDAAVCDEGETPPPPVCTVDCEPTVPPVCADCTPTPPQSAPKPTTITPTAVLPATGSAEDLTLMGLAGLAMVGMGGALTRRRRTN